MALIKRGILFVALAFFVLESPCMAKDLLFATGLNRVYLIDAESLQLLADIPVPGATACPTPSPDKTKVFVTSSNRQAISIIDLKEEKVVDTISFIESGVFKVGIYGMAISPDGERLYVHLVRTRVGRGFLGVEVPHIAVIDLKTKETIKTIEVPFGVFALVPLRDGRYLYAMARDFYLIDLVEEKIVDTVGIANPSVSGEGMGDALNEFLYGEEGNGWLSIPLFLEVPQAHAHQMGLVIIDTSTGHVEKMELGPAVTIFSAVTSPNHKFSYMVFSQVFKVDLEARRVVKRAPTEMSYASVNISSDAKRLYLSSGNPYLSMLDADSLELIKRIELPTETTALRVINY